MEPVTSELLKHGLLGIMIVILMGVSLALWRAYEKSHEDRFTDTKEFQNKYVGLVEKSVEATGDLNTTLTVIKEKLPK